MRLIFGAVEKNCQTTTCPDTAWGPKLSNGVLFVMKGWLVFSKSWHNRILALHNYYMYRFEQLPPPGELGPLRLQPSVGYRWIRLDPQGPKTPAASRISGPDGRGRRRQVPGGPEPGQHQGLIFGQSC